MTEPVLTVGTLYISREVLQYEKWMVDQVISGAMSMLSKYMGLDGFLKPSVGRKGDFSLTICDLKVSPVVVVFIGVPGRSRASIVQELFTAK